MTTKEYARKTYARYETLRDVRGMTDYRVGVEAGIAASTLSDWKNELSTPKADKFLLIAKLFNVPLEELLDISEEVS